MALTRKFLQAMGIEADKIDEIIDAHTEVTTSLKQERDSYKADAEKYQATKEELDNLKESSKGNDDFEEKYNELKAEYDKFKSDLTAKETLETKSKAVKDLLKEVGISEKRLDSILKITDMNAITLDKEGKIKDADKLKGTFETEYADFIVKSDVEGAKVSTPPAKTETHTQLSKEQIFDIKDPTERQKAIMDNPDLFPQFGFKH